MDHAAANKGAPIDDIDKALLARKNCVKCVEDEHTSPYEKYSFNSQSNSCEDAAGTAKRRFCECDKEFTSVNKTSFDNTAVNTGSCTKLGNGSGNPICCVDN